MVSEFGCAVLAADKTTVTEPSLLTTALWPLREHRASSGPTVAMNWFHTTRFQNLHDGGRCVITSASSSSSTNFYNRAYSRQGWADVAAEVRERWQSGDRDGAAGLVTDEMVLATTLIGTEEMVSARLAVWRDAGVDTVRLYPAGDTLDAKLETLGRAIELVRRTA